MIGVGSPGRFRIS